MPHLRGTDASPRPKSVREHHSCSGRRLGLNGPAFGGFPRSDEAQVGRAADRCFLGTRSAIIHNA